MIDVKDVPNFTIKNERDTDYRLRRLVSFKMYISVTFQSHLLLRVYVRHFKSPRTSKAPFAAVVLYKQLLINLSATLAGG